MSAAGKDNRGKILVANLGSTSFKFRLFDMQTETQLARGGVDRIGGAESRCAVQVGDWREELILTVDGELRIATTSVPSTGRHVTLMQDSLYRNDVALAAMGYFLPPNTSRTLFPQAFR